MLTLWSYCKKKTFFWKISPSLLHISADKLFENKLCKISNAAETNWLAYFGSKVGYSQNTILLYFSNKIKHKYDDGNRFIHIPQTQKQLASTERMAKYPSKSSMVLHPMVVFHCTTLRELDYRLQ